MSQQQFCWKVVAVEASGELSEIFPRNKKSFLLFRLSDKKATTESDYVESRLNNVWKISLWERAFLNSCRIL